MGDSPGDLTGAVDAAARTMRTRASRALAPLDTRAVEARWRRRWITVAAAVVVLLAVGAGAWRLAHPPAPLEDRLTVAIATGDHDAVAGLLRVGALERFDAAHPSEAVRLATRRCDLALVRMLTDAGARRHADDGRVREDAALVTAIRHCPAWFIRDLWRDTPSTVPAAVLMLFAATEGTPSAVRALAAEGAPLDPPGGPGPLELAIRAGRTDVAHALVALGASSRRVTSDGVRLSELLARMDALDACAGLTFASTAGERARCVRSLDLEPR